MNKNIELEQALILIIRALAANGYGSDKINKLVELAHEQVVQEGI